MSNGARSAALHKIILICAGWLLAATNVVADKPSHGHVRSSGYYGENLSEHAAKWIDDRRLLFLSPGASSPRGQASLYVWDLQTDVVSKYASLGRNAGFCLADKFLRYWYESGVDIQHYAGVLGQESRVSVDSSEYPRRGARLNRLDCSYFDSAGLPRTSNRYFRPLRHADGYLGQSADSSVDETYYLGSDGGTPILLDIPARTSALTYSVFKKSYVLQEVNAVRSLSEEIPMRFWIFSPPRDVTAATIPPGQWLRGSVTDFAPIADGYMFVSQATGRPDSQGRPTTGAGGVYVLHRSDVVRVIPGYVYGASVAPSGCSVAVNVASRFGAGQAPVIKVISLCAESGQ